MGIEADEVFPVSSITDASRDSHTLGHGVHDADIGLVGDKKSDIRCAHFGSFQALGGRVHRIRTALRNTSWPRIAMPWPPWSE